MKWFKHDSNANTDAKLKRVRMKYGMQGYGLYWYCLELIAANVDKHNLTFELEHDSEIIAHDTGINYEMVQEMMAYMADLGLFENIEGKIFCLKMATRTDEYTQQILKKTGISPDSVPSISRDCPDKVRGIRREEIDKKEKKESGAKRKRFTAPTLDDVSSRCFEMGYTISPERFWNYYESVGWRVGKNPMKDWHKALAGWQARENDGKPKGSTRDTDIRDDLTDTSWAH